MIIEYELGRWQTARQANRQVVLFDLHGKITIKLNGKPLNHGERYVISVFEMGTEDVFKSELANDTYTLPSSLVKTCTLSMRVYVTESKGVITRTWILEPLVLTSIAEQESRMLAQLIDFETLAQRVDELSASTTVHKLAYESKYNNLEVAVTELKQALESTIASFIQQQDEFRNSIESRIARLEELTDDPSI